MTCAGVVAEIGSDVTHFRPGDRVWGTNQGLLGRQGTFAEYAAIDECWLYPTPANVSDEQAAALALVAITAHLGLVRDAELLSGETLFVNGGSGGVGSAVVQIAKILGARVITTAGNERKAEVCGRLGADHVILYKATGVAGPLKKIAPTGVHVWWETLREPDFDLADQFAGGPGTHGADGGTRRAPAFPRGPVLRQRLFAPWFRHVPRHTRGTAGVRRGHQ